MVEEEEPVDEEPQPQAPPKKKSNTWMLIVMVIVGFIAAIIFVAGFAMFGDRTGVGSNMGMVGVNNNGTTGPVGACSDVLSAAETYLNRGIVYGQSGQRCGPLDTTGPTGVVNLDCSGYASRSYHDAGQLPDSGWCLNTSGIASSSNYTRVATDVSSARSVMQPGDILLFGLGSSSAHAVIYGGPSGSADIVYESGGRGGGPHRSVYNVFGGGRQLYGVYRSKGCANTTPLPPGNETD